MEDIIIENISACGDWEKLFMFLLTTCNEYKVIYPNGEYDEENPLMGGMKQFKKINDSSTKIFDKEYIVISGQLNDSSRKLFLGLLEPTFSGDKSEIWQFELYKDTKMYLNVQDFNVGTLKVEPELLDFLDAENIKI